VRIHRDTKATRLSADLNARAFTIGNDVAFGAGEYQPGTPIGDALIAHELAHVVQQGTASSSGPLAKSASDSEPLEEDADVSAVRVVVSLWSRAKAGLANIARTAIPALKSGLRLQRCKWMAEQGRKADISTARRFFKKYKATDPRSGELIDPDKLSDDEVVKKYKEIQSACFKAGYLNVDPDCVQAMAALPLARDATGKVQASFPIGCQITGPGKKWRKRPRNWSRASRVARQSRLSLGKILPIVPGLTRKKPSYGRYGRN